MQTLEYSRLCTMKDDLYMIIDYYPNVETQPMICIIQVHQAHFNKTEQNIKLPDYLQVEREITDMPEYYSFALAKRPQINN